MTKLLGRIEVFTTMQTPDKLYGELFEAIQLSAIFQDSKTFVDLIPRFSPQKILEDFRKEKSESNFDLKVFVENNFAPQPSLSIEFKSDKTQKVAEHISNLWSHLSREKDLKIEGGSLIPLPFPYIVPGGRFKEIYYWDSYFTMLGLAIDGQVDLIESMVKNFSYLIETIGHIPNGNRTYLISRSQPPFFALMVDLLAQLKGEEILIQYLPFLKKEYQFWMSPNSDRTIEIEGYTLNRYFDNKDYPREESYKEDVKLKSEIPNHFIHLRAACESGWDFSSRWLEDGKNLETIRTTDILPVDLNSLLFFLEKTIQRALELNGEKTEAAKMQQLASQRAEAINSIFFNKKLNSYVDYFFKEKKQSNQLTLAMMYPLFLNIADQEKAVFVTRVLQKKFIHQGGLVTTLLQTNEQWDFPNGWAPLQWIAIMGLKNYGQENLALEIARRWCHLMERVFQKTGKMMEKYNVVDINLDATGGEYTVQDGFGWTNGVYLAMLSLINKKNHKQLIINPL